MAIYFATGPKTDTMTREAALAAAKESPQFPKDATDIVVEELDGHWVAAVHVADNPFGGPADQTDDGPGPKSEGPGDTKPDDDGDGDSDDGGSDEGEGGPPHKEPDGDEGKGGEKHELSALLDIVTQIATALGIAPPGAEAGGLPGEEPPVGPPGPPAGPPGGPPGAGGPPAPDKLQHEKALKPGEVPPGATPVGAPAFSSVNPIVARGLPHPWERLAGIAATFNVEERVPDHYSAADVDEELREVAYGTGFKVKQTQVYTDPNGHRIAKALISAY